MKTQQTAFSITALIGKLLLVSLFPILLQAQSDTLKYRVAYYPTWAYDELPPWQVDFGGLTHIVLFNDEGITTTSPYWCPVARSADSVNIERGPANSSYRYLDSLVRICHRKGMKVMVTIQCVDGANFSYVAADSARTQLFHTTLKAWMVRKGIDGWDLDLEGSYSATTAQIVRFLRIGRRAGYDSAFPNSRALIGIATTRGYESDYPAAQVDSMITFYDLQCYVYQWMWSPNANNNATWFQTPVASPASCANCQNSSLSYDFLYGGSSLIDGWVAAGHDRRKLVIGYSTSMVTGFTGTNQLNTVWSGNFADESLVDVEAMVNYGGTWTRNATAKASYIAGTATAGNPLGISAGTKFFLPFEDSTDIKAGCDYLKSVGAGGIMFYDFYGDRRIGATPNWKKTPYIYAASMYAAKLNGGAAPAPDPSIGGTFSASADTLSAAGGSVILTWTSVNATSASIDNGIGIVSTNGSVIKTITATTRFILTLSNANGNITYLKDIYVLPQGNLRNIALRKPSTASSVDLSGNEADKANDGNVNTRWSSSYVDNQWWQVDLQTATIINSVVLTWEDAYASQFKISTSLDGQTFSDVATGNASGPGIVETKFNPVNARYVRLIGTQRGTPWGISFFELGIYEASATSVETIQEVPTNFLLNQNFPNPFNPTTEIGYQLSKTSEVRLIVYDILGKEITTLVSKVQRAGNYSATFNANNLASGMYFARLQAEGKVQIRKMILMK